MFVVSNILSVRSISGIPRHIDYTTKIINVKRLYVCMSFLFRNTIKQTCVSLTLELTNAR